MWRVFAELRTLIRSTNLSNIQSSCISSSFLQKIHSRSFSVSEYGHSRSFSVSEYGRLSTPTCVPISNLLEDYINSETIFSLSHGLKIHSYVLKTGYQSNTDIRIKLLILHLKFGSISYARQLLDEMSHPAPARPAYIYLLYAYVKNGQITDAIDLVKKMRSSRLKQPDSVTHSLILKAWDALPRSLFLAPEFLRQVHAQILIDGNIDDDDVALFATLIDSYVKSDRIDCARRLFNSMLVKNVACYVPLISGYMSNGRFGEAETLFKSIDEKDVVVFNAMIEGYSKSIVTAKKSVEMYIDMLSLGFVPTVSTFVSLVGACSLLGSAEICQQVHSHLMMTEYIKDVKIGNAVIDMYCKCGNVEYALRIFDDMPEKNVFSWTSMIDGYGKYGSPREVIELFTKMEEEADVKPNNVTFLCALSACANAGLVGKGWDIFESMERKYYLKPQMEHYVCMVDLLGRSGRLKQAWEFVMRMPENPNSDVWAALFSSARLHSDMEMAGVAADELRKLGDEAGKWDGVDEVEEFMKPRKISKDTGSLQFVVDDSEEEKQPIQNTLLFQFVADDSPEKKEPIQSVSSTGVDDSLEKKEPIHSVSSTGVDDSLEEEEFIESVSWTEVDDSLEKNEPTQSISSTGVDDSLEKEEPIQSISFADVFASLKKKEPIESVSWTEVDDSPEKKEPIESVSRTGVDDSLKKEDPIQSVSWSGVDDSLEMEESIQSLEESIDSLSWSGVHETSENEETIHSVCSTGVDDSVEKEEPIQSVSFADVFDYLKKKKPIQSVSCTEVDDSLEKQEPLQSVM